MFQPSK